MSLYYEVIVVTCTAHSVESCSINISTHPYKEIHNTSNIYFSHYQIQHICETSPPSYTTIHPYVALNKFTHHPSFQSLFSISASLMKKDGSSGLVNSLNQDTNMYYVSPKIPYVAKLGHRYLSMVSISSKFF